MGYTFNPFTGNFDNTGPAQSYDVFIYKSTGTQSGNRYNSWSDLMTAIARQEGAKTIYFEQDETIPAGSWNLDYVTLRGNGQEYNAGGYTLTFGDNTTISSWLVPGVHSLLLKSTSTTGHICTFTSAFSITFQVVSNIQSSSTYEFFSSSASGQNIIALRDSGRFSLVGGSTKELFKFTGSAFSQQVIVSLGDGAVITDNTLSSTNAVIHIPIIGSVNQALANWIPSHTNLSVGAEVPLNLTNSLALLNTAAGNIVATNVQDAINELDTEKLALSVIDAKGDLYVGSADNTVDNLTVGANNTTLVADSGETLGVKWAKRPRVLDSQYTTVGNVGTGEDDLMSYTMPANTLATNGDSITVEFSLAVANNANQKRIKVYFGGTAIFDTGATGLLVGVSYVLKFNLLVLRDASNSQRYTLEYFAVPSSGSSILGTTYGTTTKTDTSTIIIKTTGETNAASDNDVTQGIMVTRYQPV